MKTMDVGKTTFEFNMQSGAYREKMDQAGKEKLDLMQKVKDTDLQNHDADYEKHKAQRLATEKERLTQKQELDIKAPRPDWAPAPEFLTEEKIQNKAAGNVEKGHWAGRDDLEARHAIAKEDHVRQGVGLPVDQSQAGYEARRAAHMQRSEQRRQTEQPRDLPRQ